MKRSFLYQLAFVACLLLTGACTKEDVPADKPLLTEDDKSRLRDLETLGFKESYTEAEFLAFDKAFKGLSVPELDYFNELVTKRSIEFTRVNLPAAEQEPAIRQLEMGAAQRKQLNARAMRSYNKTYLHLTEAEFARTTRDVGILWSTSEEKKAPASARTAANPGCNIVWWCNKALGYNDNGSTNGHTFPTLRNSVYDAFKGDPDCDYGFVAPCSAQTTHTTITATGPYVRTMLRTAPPTGFGGSFSSQTPDASTRRLLLGSTRVTTIWGLGPEIVRQRLILLF